MRIQVWVLLSRTSKHFVSFAFENIYFDYFHDRNITERHRKYFVFTAGILCSRCGNRNRILRNRTKHLSSGTHGYFSQPLPQLALGHDYCYFYSRRRAAVITHVPSDQSCVIQVQDFSETITINLTNSSVHL